MRLLFLMVVACSLMAAGADFEKIHPEAERLIAEKSFAQARQLYEAADLSKLTAEERRWVEFRRADLLWRSTEQEGGDEQRQAVLETAEKALEALIAGRDRKDQQDRIWAEAQESLAKLLLQSGGPIRPLRMRRGDGGFEDRRKEALEHLRNALEWWASSSDVELARRRYIDIVWSVFQDQGNYYEAAPLADALENVTKIATDPNMRAWAHLTLAQIISQRGNAFEIERANAEFQAAIAAGKESQWYDDALQAYGQWLMHSGRVVWDDSGNPVAQPNPKKALEIFRKLVAEFAEIESPFVRPAKLNISQIESPELRVMVGSMFLPETTAEFTLSFRNVRQVEFTLRRIDLLRDFQPPDGRRRFDGGWGAMIKAGAGEVVKRWTKDFSDREEYSSFSESLAIDGKLAAGAYSLEATAAGRSSRELILVTDEAVVVQSAADRTLVYVCNVESGAPVSKANVKLLELYYDGQRQQMRSRDGVTGEDGLAEFSVEKNTENISQYYVLVNHSGKPAMAISHPGRGPRDSEAMNSVFAVTDRPAYRPGETVHWKITVRRRENDLLTTPAGEKVKFAINDARGGKIQEGEVTLNSFGSAWGEFVIGPEVALGECQISFNAEKQRFLGAGRFRVEEYKLPEFKVSVQTPEEGGRPKAFRLGEKVEVTVKGEYYFGGAVANAAVHVVVRTNGLYHIYQAARAYPWLYEDNFRTRRPWRGEGEIALEKDLTTDAEGKATLSLETAVFGNDDVEFTIEARMTDSSRREIIGLGKVRVTKHRYQVYANARHWLHRPGDKVDIDFQARDANEGGVVAEGKVKVTRDFWYEIWEDPTGREVKGDELKKLQDGKVFPPDARWRLKFRGYEKEDIASGTVKTDSEGKAEFAFTPARDGYYRVTWLSEDKRPDGSDGPPIKGETTVWVATNASTELGYRHGGLEIVLDKDTFRAGQKAGLMLHAPTNDRWVLLSIMTDRILRREVIHMTGTVKLVEIDIGEEHVPNFWVQAVMVSGRQIHRDQKEVVVPPVKNFLEVKVTPDRVERRVRDEGNFVVSAKDHEGKPVSAEVEFGVIDEALFYIQGEYASDPRAFFFGTKRYAMVATSSTFDQRGYHDQNQKREGRASFDSMEDTLGTSVGRFARKGMAARYDAAPPAMAMVAEMAGSISGNAAALEPVVRSDFRSTIFWQPDVKTDADGTARVAIKYPDSVTTWKASARAVTAGNQFGVGSASTRTTQPIIVRLQAPRFFVVGDEVTISAVINNNTTNSVSVSPEIAIEGLKLLGSAKGTDINVAGLAEKRIDWRVVAEKAGEAKIKVTGKSSEGSDSMERTFPVHEHGVEKFLAQSGKMTNGEMMVKIDLPAERRKDSTRVFVQATPSLAVTMLDALPYLLDYPYGCVEQTMSRFLPAAIIAKTLMDVGLDAETAMGRVFGGIEAANAAKTQPNGKKNLNQLNGAVQKGLERLVQARHGDGGWGWWPEGQSDPWMTAYVVWGLSLAKKADLNIDDALIQGGVGFLDSHLAEAEKNLDTQAWMLHAIAAARGESEITAPQRKAIENIWTQREQLNSYSRALFALAVSGFGDEEKAKTLARNLENGFQQDHWGATRSWWRWSEGPVETTAFALRALLAIDPGNKMIEPAAIWLIKNRRGAQWSNTRDTAITLLALSDYLKKSGQLNAEGEFAISVNGTEIASKKFSPKDILNAPGRFEIDAKLIRDGVNEVRFARKSGQSSLYFATEAIFFSLEEPVKPAANEIVASRRYFRLAPRPTLLKGNDYERVSLKENEPIKSGDRIEVSIIVEAKNNYEYLVFEDLKPGGFEAVQIRSGEGAFARQVKAASATRIEPLTEDDYANDSRWVYQELRDRKVASFIDQLPQGFWELRYELRAETPGKFHALPTLGHAMYVPEIRCNSAEDRVEVRD